MRESWTLKSEGDILLWSIGNQLYCCSAWKHLRPKSSTLALWMSQFTFILHTNRKQAKLTCRVACRPSKRTCWPLHHLIRYCCEVRPNSDTAMARWFSLLAVSIAAAAIWSLILAFPSIYCTFIVFLCLWVRACMRVCPFFFSSFLCISYLLTIWHHSFFIIL